MTDTTIRVSKETKRRLDARKREGESYEDVLRRLTETDRWAGFGAFAEGEGDLREGIAEIRRELREGMDERIAEYSDDPDGGSDDRAGER